jgi:hypothetical protein
MLLIDGAVAVLVGATDDAMVVSVLIFSAALLLLQQQPEKHAMIIIIKATQIDILAFVISFTILILPI